MAGHAVSMKGKRGLIMGAVNKKSIAWAIATKLHAQGADLAFTYQGETLAKRVVPLAQEVGSTMAYSCDVEDEAQIDAVFSALASRWGRIRFCSSLACLGG